MHSCGGLCYNPKFLLRYLVTLYFWISQKYLKSYPNELGSVKSVLFSSIKYRVWVQVQLTKNWAPSLKLKFKFNTWSYLDKYWILILISIVGNLLKWLFINNFVQTIVSFISTKFVLCNGIVYWKVWLIINHQIIPR